MQDFVFPCILLLPDGFLHKITCKKLNALTHKTDTCTELIKWRCLRDRSQLFMTTRPP